MAMKRHADSMEAEGVRTSDDKINMRTHNPATRMVLREILTAALSVSSSIDNSNHIMKLVVQFICGIPRDDAQCDTFTRLSAALFLRDLDEVMKALRVNSPEGCELTELIPDPRCEYNMVGELHHLLVCRPRSTNYLLMYWLAVSPHITARIVFTFIHYTPDALLRELPRIFVSCGVDADAQTQLLLENAMFDIAPLAYRGSTDDLKTAVFSAWACDTTMVLWYIRLWRRLGLESLIWNVTHGLANRRAEVVQLLQRTNALCIQDGKNDTTSCRLFTQYEYKKMEVLYECGPGAWGAMCISVALWIQTWAESTTENLHPRIIDTLQNPQHDAMWRSLAVMLFDAHTYCGWTHDSMNSHTLENTMVRYFELLRDVPSARVLMRALPHSATTYIMSTAYAVYRVYYASQVPTLKDLCARQLNGSQFSPCFDRFRGSSTWDAFSRIQPLPPLMGAPSADTFVGVLCEDVRTMAIVPVV